MRGLMVWEFLNDPLSPRVVKILTLATEYGWDPSPVTLVARLKKDYCHPFYISWVLDLETMKYRFEESRVNKWTEGGLQKLSFRDLGVYIQHPDVIEEKPKKISGWGPYGGK
jgi:hypothetical protein